MRGESILAMWLDQSEESEKNWRLSHTTAHMPERVALPGFLRGRRYQSLFNNEERYFILYEAVNLSAFCSRDYLRKLNAPDARTREVRSSTLRMVRGAAALICSKGAGLSGCISTFRFVPKNMEAAEFKRLATNLIEEIQKFEGVTSSSVYLTHPDITRVETETSRIRGDEKIFRAVLLVEGILAEHLQIVAANIDRRLCLTIAGCVERFGLYQLSYALQT